MTTRKSQPRGMDHDAGSSPQGSADRAETMCDDHLVNARQEVPSQNPAGLTNFLNHRKSLKNRPQGGLSRLLSTEAVSKNAPRMAA